MIDVQELIVDSFAGGGGASTGIELALGRSPNIAINHDAEAIALHAANHPSSTHYCESVWRVDPVEACAGRPVGLAWFSPDCKHFSKAKGGKPVSKKVRGLAWVVTRWAKTVRPRVIALENVEEFQTWGPLLEDGTPCPVRKGLTFRRWIAKLRSYGYHVEHRELRACDYGAPTFRKRLFLIARCDGQPIVWPEPTHGPGRLPYRTAADCIDWSLPCPSIFTRTKPLAENTLRRIARGIRKYVLDAPRPFIVTMRGTEASHVRSSARGVDEPLRTVSASGSHHGLVTPFVARTDMHQSNAGCVYPVDHPLRTVTTGGGFGLVAPTLVQTGYGERVGQAPRALDLQEPLGTVVAGGAKHALVSAFLARHYGGEHASGAPKCQGGADLREPMGTVTVRDHHALVTADLDGGADRREQVRAFLLAYYGTDQDPQLSMPLPTVTTRDRFGVVTVAGLEHVINDIGMRMLVPRELYRAQGFPASYRIEIPFRGKPISKTAQVRMCGNSVCPPLAAAIVRANIGELARMERAA